MLYLNIPSISGYFERFLFQTTGFEHILRLSRHILIHVTCMVLNKWQTNHISAQTAWWWWPEMLFLSFPGPAIRYNAEFYKRIEITGIGGLLHLIMFSRESFYPLFKFYTIFFISKLSLLYGEHLIQLRSCMWWFLLVDHTWFAGSETLNPIILFKNNLYYSCTCCNITCVY